MIKDENESVKWESSQGKKMKTQIAFHPQKVEEESEDKISQRQASNMEEFMRRKKQVNHEQQWQSEKELENSKQKKIGLAGLLLNLQLHKMGFSFPKFEKQVEEYLRNFDLEDVPTNEITFWVSSHKNKVVEKIIMQHSPQKKNFSASSHKSEMSELSKEGELEKRERNKTSQKIQLMCSICYQLTFDYEKRTCNHNFCNSCIRYHILQNIDSGDFDLDCPMYDCPNEVEDFLIKKLLSESEQKKLYYFKKKTQLEKNPLNKFCSQPDCGEVLKDHENGSLKCPKCNHEYCQICLQNYHKNTACDETILKALKETYQKFQIKKCPKCASPIQKIDGCNHMACKKCKTQFCWICLSVYSDHHFRYYNCCGCPGLQFGDEDELPRQRCKQLALYILSPIIIAVFACIFFLCLPLYMIFTLLTKPCQWIGSDFDTKCEKSLVQNICCCLPGCIQSLMLYFVFMPRALAYAVFLAPVKYFCYFCHGTHDAVV